MKHLILIASLFMVSFYGCAGEDQEAVTDDSQNTEASTANDNNKAASASNSSEKDATQSESSDANSVENLPWTFLVSGIYHNNATIGAGSDAKNNINKGHWINFDENGTYEYGVWDKKQYTGTWFYDGNTNIMDLTPKDDHKPSQWTVMHKDDNLIWLGTSKYGNNALQIQWLRRDGYPSK
jgi:hypothetical protein